MAKKDSLNNDYFTLKKLYLIKSILFWVVILETFVSIWLVEYMAFQIFCIAIVSSFYIISVSYELLNYRLEKYRVVNAIEVGFSKSIDSNVETKGYYNNGLNNGINKFNLNIFESVFFTKKIFEKSIVKKFVSYLIFFIILVISLSIASFNIACVICEIIFSCGILYEIYKNILFYIEINHIFSLFDCAFVSGNFKKQKEAMLAYSFQYEKLKSYISLSLSSKSFNKMNNDLSKEWNNYLNSRYYD